jgi:uncharacterized membrane protein
MLAFKKSIHMHVPQLPFVFFVTCLPHVMKGTLLFCSVQGAWGFWYLPGTPSFHVYWTGVAEVLGGVGITLGAAQLPFLPDWLLPASAFGLFLLTAVVTPANMYMWTHNSPGPTPEETLEKTGGVLPVQFHLGRALMQVVLLSTFLGLAVPPN